MDEASKPDEATVEPELKQPEEPIKDLEPDKHEGDDVKGGAYGQQNKYIP